MMPQVRIPAASCAMSAREPPHARLVHSVIGAFYEVYNVLGFGYLEQLYVAALTRELRARGHRAECEVSVPALYKGEVIGCQRLDLLVDRSVVVETKATVALHPSATRQVYNYLCGTGLRVGLLLHFGPEPRFYRVARGEGGR
jgi:GxxExxY protein